MRDLALLVGDEYARDSHGDHAVEPFGLVGQRGVGALDFGQVPHETGEERRPAQRDLHRGQLHGAFGAVGAQRGDVHLAGEFPRVTGLDVSPDVLQESLPVPLRDQEVGQ